MDSLPRLSTHELDKIRALACTLTRNAADADDIIQEAFLFSWQKRDGLPADFALWFSLLVTNCARNQRRKQYRFNPANDDSAYAVPSQHEGPDSAAIRLESRGRLQAALADLDMKTRDAVALCYIAGFADLEGSKITGISLKAFKSRVKRGRNQLAATLAE